MTANITNSYAFSAGTQAGGVLNYEFTTDQVAPIELTLPVALSQIRSIQWSINSLGTTSFEWKASTGKNFRIVNLAGTDKFEFASSIGTSLQLPADTEDVTYTNTLVLNIAEYKAGDTLTVIVLGN